MIDKNILFSGRFCPPHLGHLITIARLGQLYRKVIIVILDYYDSEYSIQYRRQALEEALKHTKGNYEIIVNTDHFGTITKEKLQEFNFNIYASGNLKVLKHIENLGFPTLYVERSFDYSGTEIRNVIRKY